MIRTMSNAAIHFGGGIAVGVLTVFAAVGALGMMMGKTSSSLDDRYHAPPPSSGTTAYGRSTDTSL